MFLQYKGMDFNRNQKMMEQMIKLSADLNPIIVSNKHLKST